MIEMLPLYVIAGCAILIAIGVYVNLVLTVRVLGKLKRRELARNEAFTNFRRRLGVVEDYLLKRFGGRVDDSRFQNPNSRTLTTEVRFK
jgi:hypothetical protein